MPSWSSLTTGRMSVMTASGSQRAMASRTASPMMAGAMGSLGLNRAAETLEPNAG
jgi:hypothetical protein